MARGTRYGPLLALSAAVLAALAPGLARAQGRMSVEDRLGRLERQLDSNTLVDILDRLDRLTREVRELRGEVEDHSGAVSDLSRRQKELFLDLDRRLKRMEGGAGSAAAESAASSGTAPSQRPAAGAASGATGAQASSAGAAAGPAAGPTASAAPAASAGPAPAAAAPAAAAAGADPLKEQNQYQQAFGLLKEGRYDQAAKAFGAFLKTYPSGPYSDNAQYWLGESYYVNRQFQPAMTEFNKLVQSYPDSAKVSHAKLKVGLIYAETGETERARKALEEVATRYPTTPQGRLARERLEKMKAEGK